MPLEIFKRGQGKLARLAAAGFLGILVVFGCTELYRWLVRYDALREGYLGRIPFVEQDLNVAFIAVAAIVAAGAYGIYRVSNKPKVADLLIDTETELKKVTWPSWPEAVNSSIVVIVAVVVIAVYLAGVDFVLNQVFGVVFPK
jgi:preprotein translocase subunit SecE